eukprot:2816290-Rhodomonas_salina.2
MVPDFWREGKDFFFGRHINMGDLVVVKRADGTMRFAQVSGGAGGTTATNLRAWSAVPDSDLCADSWRVAAAGCVSSSSAVPQSTGVADRNASIIINGPGAPGKLP